jgi:hypothetical protein
MHVVVRCLLLPALLLALGAHSAVAQIVSAAATNPLMQLMVRQPPIDISSPVNATASFDPPLVRVGDKALYRITFNAIEASIQLPPLPQSPRGLTLRQSAQGQILQATTNAFLPFTTFNFEAHTSRAGFFTIPAFYALVYGRPVLVPETILEAVEELPAGVEPLKQLLLEFDSTNMFFGESVNVRVLSPPWGGNVLQALTQLEFNGDGIVAEKNPSRQSVQSIERNGRRYSAFIYETTITPITAGQLPIFAEAFTAGRHFTGPITIQGNVVIPGGPPQYVLLESEPVTLNVRPLPAEGRLPGFTGAVGRYTYDSLQLSTNVVRVGDPVYLKVVIRGKGPLDRLIPPTPAPDTNWQVFPAIPGGFVAANANTELGALFSYTFVPLTDRATSTPPIPFSTFDPATRLYVDATIPGVSVKVVADVLATEFQQSFAAADSVSETERKLALSALARSPGVSKGDFHPLQLQGWFLAAQLVPATFFSGIWAWDRRRRHLERHPEIVLRRKARRALRRQRRLLQRAASDGDAPQYAKCSVSALQIACAPHYPAEPNALVCADILEVLEKPEREGESGNVVRRFFEAANDSRFAVTPHNHANVLNLKTELDTVLEKLEARL